MGKVIDITERLEGNENPSIRIGDKEYEINADAHTVLKIMGLMQDGDFESHILEAFNLLFPSKVRKEFEKMKLSFCNLIKIVEVAMKLATGEEDGEDDPGETTTRTTT